MRRPSPTPAERLVYHAISLVITALGLSQLPYWMAALLGLD